MAQKLVFSRYYFYVGGRRAPPACFLGVPHLKYVSIFEFVSSVATSSRKQVPHLFISPRNTSFLWAKPGNNSPWRWLLKVSQAGGRRGERKMNSGFVFAVNFLKIASFTSLSNKHGWTKQCGVVVIMFIFFKFRFSKIHTLLYSRGRAGQIIFTR